MKRTILIFSPKYYLLLVNVNMENNDIESIEMVICTCHIPIINSYLSVNFIYLEKILAIAIIINVQNTIFI